MGIILLVALLAAAVGLDEPAWAIPPRPGTPDALGVSQASYFRIRPGLIDQPEVPASIEPAGSVRALVVLIDFADKPADRASNNPAFFRTKLFGEGRPSLRSYLDEASYGKLLLDGDVTAWYRSDRGHYEIVNRDGVAGTGDDYGLDTSSDAIAPGVCAFPLNVWGLARHAAELASRDIDLGQYDNDGPDGEPHSADDDGYVDALFIVHAGIGAEIRGSSPGSENYIWSLKSNLDHYAPTRDTEFDGVRVGAFIMVPELGEIGVFAHEFCHLLGLPDLYNSATGESVVGPLCLMDLEPGSGPRATAACPAICLRR